MAHDYNKELKYFKGIRSLSSVLDRAVETQSRPSKAECQANLQEIMGMQDWITQKSEELDSAKKIFQKDVSNFGRKPDK